MRRLTSHIACLLMFAPVLQTFTQPVMRTTVSARRILIGEPVELQWEASLPSEGFIRWPVIPDTIPHFEWLERMPVDTTFSEKGISRLRQRFRFTSFDSGSWVFPSFAMAFKPVDRDSSWQLQTDSFTLQVGFEADSTGAIRDIKPLRVLADDPQTWYWVAAVAAVMLLVAAAVWWYRRWRLSAVVTARDNADPYTTAMNAFEALAGQSVNERTGSLLFHQRLSDIFRAYLAQRTGISANSKTTSDLLVDLRRQPLSAEQLSGAASALRCCDAVKFARFHPDPVNSRSNRETLVHLVSAIESFYQNKSSA